MKAKYYLSILGKEPIEVTQEEFIQAERSAGFRPKPGCGPVATGGFDSGALSGSIKYEKEDNSDGT